MPHKTTAWSVEGPAFIREAEQFVLPGNKPVALHTEVLNQRPLNNPTSYMNGDSR